MPRLMGVDIPNDKQIQYSLTYLYGVGLNVSREVCEKLGIEPTRPASDIQEEDLGRIAALLERDYTVEGPLRRQVAQNISRLREIKSYRGMRHRASLPCVASERRQIQGLEKVLVRPSPVKKALKIFVRASGSSNFEFLKHLTHHETLQWQRPIRKRVRRNVSNGIAHPCNF